jgi:hypothetical protein
MRTAEFLAPAVVPLIFLISSWLLTRNWKLALRIACVGLCVLLSLPIGFVLVVSSIGWTYVLDAGHNPGWAVILIPLIVGWFACIAVWLAGTLVALVTDRTKLKSPS